MGQIEVQLPPEQERQNLLRLNLEGIQELLPLLKELAEEAKLLQEKASPGLKKMYNPEIFQAVGELFEDMCKDMEEESLPLENLRNIRRTILEFVSDLQRVLSEKGKEYRVEVDPKTGERRLIEYKGARQEPPRDPLIDLENIRKAQKGNLVKVSKDLWKSQLRPGGDALDFIQDEKIKSRIRKKEKEGVYLAGTRTGLYGGDRYFKLFCIALAQILNEQSKYFHTQDDLSGVPQELISQYAGEGAIVEKIREPNTRLKGGERPYPIILLSWEDIAKKMSSTGEIAGGKDIKQVRDYVLGGKQKRTDKKTGRQREVFVPGLIGREYLVEGEGCIVGLPFMSKLLSLYPKDSPDKEVGIVVQLSPLFTLKNLIGYTGIRPDTIQLLGGGRQRELTLNLFMFLAYYRGVPPQSGRSKGEFVQRKKDLLKELSQGLSSYEGRPGLLESHFQEAIQKCVDAKILLPGKSKKGGLRGYREEVNPGGDKLCVFVYNPDYLKGEEVSLFSDLEEQ